MTESWNIHTLNFFRKMIMISHFFFAPLFLLESGFSGWEIGLLASLYGFAPIIVSFPAGIINDRFSIKIIINISLLAMTVLFSLIGSVSSFPAMAAIFLMMGLTNSTLDTSVTSLYYKDDARADDNKKYGRFVSWISLGAVIGVICGGYLSFTTSFRHLFLAYAFIFFALLIVARNIKDARFHVIPLSSYKENIFNKKTSLFLLLTFIMTLHWGVESTIYSPFLKNFFELNNFQVSLYIAIALFFLAVGSYTVEKMEYNKKRNQQILLAGLFFSGIGHIFMINSNIYISVSLRMIHEFGDGLTNTIILIIVASLFEKKSIGGSAGIFMTIMTLGSMVGALIFSPLGYSLGFEYAFITSGVILLLNSVFGYFIFQTEDY